MTHSPDIRLDVGRSERIGMPEAVLCEFKTPEQCATAVSGLLARTDDCVIATRITPDQHALLSALDPDAKDGTTMVWRPRPAAGTTVSIVSAGTSDLPVAAEAALTLQALGHHATTTTDVGVAGAHRLLDSVEEFNGADAIIVVAGMEGALATVVAGLVGHPIVAVPTSVGYGTSFEGMAALLTMLSSCAPGISVVGIDNGYGAACAVHRILQRR